MLIGDAVDRVATLGEDERGNFNVSVVAAVVVTVVVVAVGFDFAT